MTESKLDVSRLPNTETIARQVDEQTSFPFQQSSQSGLIDITLY